MADRPTDTVTFLFTDIEGSARLWEQDPQAMREALARHDAIVRAAIESHRGYVFKTMGDAFCAAFPAASDALSAAVAFQTALRAAPWGALGPLRVRAALHAGSAHEQDGDYLGPAVNRVARLVALAHGGQVLLSRSVCELAQDGAPGSPEGGWRLRDLGAHRLRDLSQPEQVYQLLHPELPHEFLPLRSLDTLPNNLPRELTSFIGRESEMAEVHRLLGAAHLLTLTGPGGCGKTRLALHVAAELLHDYRDGVWLVELAALADPSLVAQTVAAQLSVPDDPQRPVLACLTNYLRDRELLLVLDNCEHLVEASACLAESLLRACPKLRILATSREPLGAPGEVAWPVPSLSQPEVSGGGDAALPPASLRQYESVRLFMERAAAVAPRFAVPDESLPIVVQICRRLDGIPLAIELAAVRVKVLSLRQIADRLDDRFRLLTGGVRTALPRQQTLRAAIDWSHDLLTQPERALLRRLAVFAGGWTLEAAESVAADGELDHYEVLETLGRLVDRSLVAVDPPSPGEEVATRYRLLETVRQYALERLEETGETSAVRGRHHTFYMEQAEQAEPELEGPAQLEWLDRLQREQDNLRAALAWSVDPETRLRLAGALWRYWYQRGPLAEGRAWLEGALARAADCSPAARAKACSGAGNLAAQQGDYDAARTLHEESLSLRRQLEDRRGIAGSLNNLGIAARRQGDVAVAREYFTESLSINRELGDAARIAAALVNLWVIAYECGEDAAALPWLEESRAIYEELGDEWRLAIVLHNLGKTALRQENLEEAVWLFQSSLTLFRRLGDRSSSVLCLNGLAMVAAARRDFSSAARLFAAEGAARAAAGAPLPLSDQPEAERLLAAVRSGLDEPGFEAAWAEGQRMGTEEAIEYALEGHST